MIEQQMQGMFEHQARASALFQRVSNRILGSKAQNLGTSRAVIRDNHLLFSSAEAKDAWEACQEARYSLLASFMLNLKADESKMLSEVHSAMEKPTPIIFGSGGVTFGQIDDTVIIQIPESISESHTNAIIVGLFEIHDLTRKSWIVDLSAIMSLPLNLMWALAGFKDSLESLENRRFCLVWLRPAALKISTFVQTLELFNLTTKAGYLFSNHLFNSSELKTEIEKSITQ